MRGFFQALAGMRTTEMLLMVWRIMQGMEIRDVQVGYRRQQEFKMTVVCVRIVPLSATSLSEVTSSHPSISERCCLARWTTSN